ncbi:MAG: DUF669 domain-containing protein [Smithella sp.]
MADLGGMLDATGSKGREFEPLPPGDYPGVILSSERKASKDKPENEYIKLEIQVEKADGSTRKIIDMVHLFNTNPTVVQIAKKQLEEIILATASGRSGNPNPNAIQNTEQLHNIMFMAKVGVKPAQGQYGPTNTIVKYQALDFNSSNPANNPYAVGATNAATTQAPQSVKPAWEV